MQTRRLGSDGLVVSAIGLGCMGMSFGYGEVDEAEALATVDAALDRGVTFLDTAQSYGGGENERLLSRVVTRRREDVVLATKFGVTRDEDGLRLDGRPERVRGFLDASLSRLGVDHVDLYYLHRVDPQVPVTETIGAMADLVHEGKISHIGVSEITVADLEAAAGVHPIAALQLEWSLSWRQCEDAVVPAARRLGIGLVAFGPLGYGLLTGAIDRANAADVAMRAIDDRFAGDALAQNLRLVEAVAKLAREHDATPAQIALAWLLAQGDDVVPIPGTKRRDRLAENVGAVDLQLTPEQLDQIERAAPRGAWEGDRASFAVPDSKRANP